MNNLRTNQRETSQEVSNSVERDIASESSSFNSAGANRDRMSNMIESIIRREIQGGCVFDAHAIIEYIIQHDRDLYVQTNVRQWTTEFYHSDISKKIARFEDSLIESLGNSWSLNIRKRFSNNKCWRKLT